ncbi:MAG TPA: Hsp20/alpha crystallin family protein [bacterium]|nr:Hsp20/alpha crystallin family protein [bacterium]HPN32302.1 Hsp20/alpha crystallin family protein [bacterium]
MLFSKHFFDDDFFDDLFEFALPKNAARFQNVARVFPNLNIYEDESNYYISAELPGISKKDLKIKTANDTLSIEGKRENVIDDKAVYYRNERWSGEFKRTISLSELVNKEKIQAELKNGVLLIALAKSEEVKPKSIEIK